MLIRRDQSLLLVVDLQEKLTPAIHQGDAAIANNLRLLGGARHLGVPIFVSEQYVRGLGPTLPAIKAAAVNAHFFEKIHFSCAAEPGVLELLHAAQRPQVVLTGTEAHVCVLQTGLGLLGAGFQVFVVADATASRTPDNRSVALERLRAAGAVIVSTEMVLFEWLAQAGTDDFRAVLPLIK